MQIIPDISRTKEIIKIRAESNKTESRGTREKWTGQSLFLGKINKINTVL